MKPLSTFLRLHHPLIALFMVGMPAVCGLVTGWGSLATHFGWSIAAGWTMAVLVEVMALAAGRWRPSTQVAASTLVLSLASLFVVIALRVSFILSTVDGLRWWGSSDPEPLYLVVLGTEVWMSMYSGLLLTITWLGLLMTVLLVRSHWRARGQGAGGAVLRVALVILTFLWATTEVIAVESSRSFFYSLGVDVYSVEWQSTHLQPGLFGLWTLLMAFMLWSVRSWLSTATATRSATILMASVGCCLLPFVVGMLAFDNPLKEQAVMGPWYVVSITMLPVVLWFASVVVLRSRGSSGDMLR